MLSTAPQAAAQQNCLHVTSLTIDFLAWLGHPRTQRPTKPLHVQPVMLSTNLAELTSLLHSDGVKAHSQLFDANQDSMKTLTHFLKRYSKGLAADTPLRAQRHKLEFVLPCALLSPEPARSICGSEQAWSWSGPSSP